MSYVIEVWGGSVHAHWIQKRAIRVMRGLLPSSSVCEVLQVLMFPPTYISHKVIVSTVSSGRLELLAVKFPTHHGTPTPASLGLV